MMTSDELYRINDALTALAADLGYTVSDDTLNELTHTVGVAIETDETD